MSIANFFIENSQKEHKLLDSYGIRHLFIFGSYAKNTERVDSGVGLLVIMNQDLTNKEKEDSLMVLSDMFYKKQIILLILWK